MDMRLKTTASVSEEMMPSAVGRVYLIAYNAAQAFGWTYALQKLLGFIVAKKSTGDIYEVTGELIVLLQSLAFLEVLHAAIGLVPARVLPCLMQWGGRFHFVAAVVSQISEIHDYPGVFVTFLAWCLSEVIRYPQYALNLAGICPGWLTWLRYSAFVVLYPLGAVGGEMLTIYEALPFIEEKKLYSSVFEKIHITYYSFVKVLLLCYPFFWLKLYLYMFKQRASRLGGSSKRKGTAQKERAE